MRSINVSKKANLKSEMGKLEDEIHLTASKKRV
jgi:hypothetical protein